MRRFALLVLVGACSAEGPDPVVPDGRLGDGGPSACEPGLPFDLDGKAAVLATLHVHVTASGIVNAETIAELLLLLDVDQTGQSLVAQVNVCNLQIPDIPLIGQEQPIHLILDPAQVEAVGPLTVPSSLDGTTTCARLTTEPVTFSIGARLDAGEPMPVANNEGTGFTLCSGETCAATTDMNCVCDQEDDGHPGVTLRAENAPFPTGLSRIYAAVRATFSLDGEVISSDRVEGGVDATLEQSIVGCAKGSDGNTPCTTGEASDLAVLLAFNPTIAPSTIEPSTFRSVRVGASLTCAELRAMRDTLFD